MNNKVFCLYFIAIIQPDITVRVRVRLSLLRERGWQLYEQLSLVVVT